MSYNKLYKLLFVGDGKVGKSSLISVYNGNQLYESRMDTIGIDFKTDIIRYNGEVIMLQIWDTAGQDRFRFLTKNYYRNTSGIFFVFDLTNKESFDNLEYWISEIRNNTNPNVDIILVGNKTDKDDKVVSNKMARAFVQKHKLLSYVTTSAKNETNIRKMFLEMVKAINNRDHKYGLPETVSCKDSIILGQRPVVPDNDDCTC